MRLFILALTLSTLSAGPVLAQTEAPGATPIALVEEAYLAHRKGDFEVAIRGYSNIIQRRGLTRRERAVSYLLRGEAKRDAGKLDESALDFTRALRQWPGYPQAHFFRGRVYERQGKLMEAYADIVRASELDPMRESYQTALSVLRKRIKDSGLEVSAAPKPLEPDLPLEDF